MAMGDSGAPALEWVDTQRWVDYYREPWGFPVQIPFPYYADRKYALNRVTVDVFVKLVRGEISHGFGPVYVVDARSSGEFAAGHIKCGDVEAFNVPYDEEMQGFPNIRQLFRQIYRRGLWLFHCHLCAYRGPNCCLAFRYLHDELFPDDGPFVAFVAEKGDGNEEAPRGGYPEISRSLGA